MPERSRTTAPAPASSQPAEPSRLEGMLQKLIQRMEESDRRYGEALEELHGRLESLAHQAQSARQAGVWGDTAELERVETQAAGLADRLREAEVSRRTPPESSTLRDIEQRITAFAEEMSAASGPAPFERPFMDFGHEHEPAAAEPQPEWRPPYAPPYVRDEDLPIASAPREPMAGAPREPEMGASDFDQRFRDITERLDKSLSEPPAARELETMREEVEHLSHSFDSALGQPGEAQSLNSIDRKLDELARYFDRAEQQHGRMASIESQLLQLIDMMQGSGSPIEEAANRAAQAAARLVAGEASGASALERLDAIQMELRAISERTRTMDERTVDTLEAMNDTLKNLAGRVGVTRGGSPAPSAPRAVEPFRAETGPVPPEFLDIPTHHEAPRPAGAKASQRPGPSPEEPAHREEAPDYDHSETHPTETREAPRRREMVPSDDDFIASARRAAQAAARQAQEQSSGFGLLRRASSIASTAGGGVTAGDDRFEPNEGRKSRRLLVFAAIFLLIVSAALLYSRLKSKDDSPVATPTEQSAPPAKPSGSSSGKQGRGEPTPRRNDGSSLVGSAPDEAPATTVLTRAPAGPPPREAAPDAAALSVPGVSIEVRPAQGRAGLPENAGTAALRSAAIAGDAAAQYALATQLTTAKDGERDFAEAARWYEKAAAQGFAPAQFRLAALYERGQGVPQDRGRAKAWYLRAAEQGNVNAMHNLAVLYADRSNENADYRAAVKWFQAAASHGLPDSQFNLGILYEAGLGVQKSLAEAYKWFSLAAARGDTEASKRAEMVKLQLPAEALRQVDEAIAQWQAEPLRDEANAVTAGRPADTGEKPAAPRTGEDFVLKTQTLLQALGYDVGAPDGLLGPRTEAAIRLFQERVGLPLTGRPSDELLARLRARAS